MKKILSIAMLVFAFAAAASAQQIEKLLHKYMEDERFNYIFQKRAGIMDRMSDMNMDVYVLNQSRTSLGRQMLTLSASDKSLEEQFTKEVDNALKADKYEQISIVRNGKNRVETYEKTTDKGISRVSFIKNPGNIVLTLNLYGAKKTK